MPALASALPAKCQRGDRGEKPAGIEAQPGESLQDERELNQLRMEIS